MAARRIKFTVPTKSFTITMTEAAHARLRAAVDKFGIGADHIVTIMLERLNSDSIAKHVEAYIEQNASAPKVSEAAVEAYLKSLSVEERHALVARIYLPILSPGGSDLKAHREPEVGHGHRTALPNLKRTLTGTSS